MPPKKKRKQPQKRKSTPDRTKFLAVLLVVVLVAGVATVKFFKTTRGKAFLLDRGFTVYYDQVQEEIGKGLLEALDDLGLKDSVEEQVEIAKFNGKRCHFLRWEVFCGKNYDLLRANITLTQAVRRLGAHVRESVEEEEGNVLRFEVGTKRYLTHRILFLRGARRPITEKKPRHKLAIVIDDFGYAKNDLAEAFLSIDIPLTISVIPTLPHSKYAASQAIQYGKEVMLHLPMEAVEPVKSDVEMVLTSMSDRRIQELVERYIDAVPDVSGVNNHMGSLATQDERVMRAVLSVLKKRGLFFLDSLTSNKSIAYNTAESVGVGTARNVLFLDADTQDTNLIKKRLRRLLTVSERDGIAVGIGHPRRWTLEAIQSSRTIFEQSGVQLVFVSDLVEL